MVSRFPAKVPERQKHSTKCLRASLERDIVTKQLELDIQFSFERCICNNAGLCAFPARIERCYSVTLKIAKSELDKLRLHGEESYPQECCGILLGSISGDHIKQVHCAVRCINTHTDPSQDYYNIDPLELMRIEREASSRGHDIIGFYHSHPDWPARWSRNDLEEAHWTGCSYVITSVQKGRATETNSFELVGEEESKHFEKEDLQVDV
jgi:proteasome lid subunit RPN8/RPN11